MKRATRVVAVALLVTITSAATPAAAVTVTFEDVFLTADQGVPPTPTSAAGLAKITYDTDAKTLSIDVAVVGIRVADLNPVALGSPFHIHVAPPGANGPIAIPLGTVGDWVPLLVGPNLTELGASLALSNLDVPSLLSGVDLATFESSLLYLNVHTLAHPAGEIRGDFGPIPEPGTGFLLALGLAGLGALRRLA